MLTRTKGIVLGSIRYKESSVIVKIYTEAYGLQTYIHNSVRKAKAKTSAAFFQPLTLLDMVVYHDEKKEIHRISELRMAHSYQTVHSNPVKMTVALFISEVLNKSLHDSLMNKELFEFIFGSLQWFDTNDQKDFHISFLMKLSVFLGFGVHTSEEFLIQIKHSSNEGMESVLVNYMDLVLNTDFAHVVSLTKIELSKIIDLIILYYQAHIESFGTLKSLKVLREI
ncbi:MAG: DNA repair protein RecO [Bacteroidota bacterium]|nr:DNA repair protein RecO [Bacteroidota bacterium]